MTEAVRTLYESILDKKHHMHRRDCDFVLAEMFSRKGLSPTKRVCERLVRLLAEERPVLLKNERIALLRTVRNLPAIFTDDELQQIRKDHFLHESGVVNNLSPGYADVIALGLEFYRQKALRGMDKESNTKEQKEFFESVTEEIGAVYALCDRYRHEAEVNGNKVIANLFAKLPRNGASSFHEALQMFRILHYTLWCEGSYHNTVGRFDQYIYPYLKADLENGVLTKAEAYDLLLEFFISFNRDADLYPGVQQGDNGQSMILGGVDKNGVSCFNILSRMCLEASKELKMIDPKINLRVDSNTPHEIFVLATELTKEGLGFPQYANDDIVIQGLVEKGYSLEDAREYAVAACWEFIIPKYGADIPNIGALSFPLVVDRCLRENLEDAADFRTFIGKIKSGIGDECAKIIKNCANLWAVPAPFLSLFMDGCMDTGNDISKGCKYNNYGFHGTGLATAVDSLAAIKKYVYDEKLLTASELIRAVDMDFEGYGELLAKLRYEAPKFGNNDDYADAIAVELLDTFADALESQKNERGGCIRPGTGSAMYYLWHSGDIGASPDGRRKGEPFSANYAPSLFARIKGPLSVIQSFTKPNLKRCINGGPLTMEFLDTMFQNRGSVEKVAGIVEYFIKNSGHQYQLNAVNRETLLDAQKNPEKYKNLIVRVWGWSAYFVELDKEYQDHVISRQEYS